MNAIYDLSRAEAAAYLTQKHKYTTSKATLAKLATVGGGPKFRHAGKYPRYSREDLDAWYESKLGPVVSSTSGKAGRPGKTA